jgi:hypothetical protein
MINTVVQAVRDELYQSEWRRGSRVQADKRRIAKVTWFCGDLVVRKRARRNWGVSSTQIFGIVVLHERNRQGCGKM